MWNTLRRQIWLWRGVLIAGPSVAVLIVVLRLMGLFQLLEWAALDQFFLLRPLEPIDSQITIVGISEEDIQFVKQWPMPDKILAQLLEKVKRQQPSVIGLDLYRDLPVNPGYADLVEVFKTTPNLIGIQKAVSSGGSAAVAPPPVLKQRGQVSANDIVLDGDGKVRRGLLYLTPKNGNTIEGLGLRVALAHLESQGITPEAALENSNYLQLGQSVFRIFEKNDGGYAWAPTGGYQVLLNFRGPAHSFPIVSLQDVLQDRVPTNLMRDRIILIGVTAQSLNDLFYTPYSSSLLTSPEPMAGVEIQAHLTSQILNAALFNRPLIKTWMEPLEWLWILGWSLVGATLSWRQRSIKKVAPLPQTAIGITLTGSSLVGICYLAFLGSWWIPVVPPLLALVGAATVITGYSARTAEAIRKTFGRYLNDEVVVKLLETPEGLKLGGERCKVTILMSDIRGFSAISERLPPEKVVAFLNIYLGVMTEVITQYNGTIDEFIGDAILVIFGAPNQRKDDAQRAVACAIAMQLAMEKVNEQIRALDLPSMEMGIGINTGEVIVGNIGSTQRAKYGVVGSHVNLAGRIESYTVGGQILISEFTLQDAGSIFRINRQVKVEPKGMKEPVTLYDIGGIRAQYNLFLREAEDNLCTLKQPIAIRYTVLDEKHVVGTVFEGSFAKLSSTKAELFSEQTLVPLSNIKINYIDVCSKSLPGKALGDVYAKVVEVSAEDNTHFLIYFTAIPPEVSETISELIAQV